MALANSLRRPLIPATVKPVKPVKPAQRGSGLWLKTKRLEEGTFSWPRTSDVQDSQMLLAPEAFAMLTDGIDLRGAKMRPWYQRE